LQRFLQITSDGSHTFFVPELNATYHSKHGAIGESEHIFINEGLKPLLHKYSTLSVFEMGMGTGLNVLLTLQQAIEKNQLIHYTAIELFPLTEKEYTALNYCSVPALENLDKYFKLIHNSAWNSAAFIHPLFRLVKLQELLTRLNIAGKFHLIYYDAFAPDVQPELLTIAVFKNLYSMLHAGGILVTYCSKGVVQRAMRTAGFIVEKLPGPKGKREILKAVKE
jgi:tRNA U34 5-methylaminomethyl-2-thiouridine-forming methyltransferase MnmC